MSQPRDGSDALPGSVGKTGHTRMTLQSILNKYTIALITPDALLEDLYLDGIKPAIAADLDELHGIEIPDRDVDAWQTVADIARTVERLANNASQSVPETV